MNFTEAIQSFFFYLAHPFRTHRALKESPQDVASGKAGFKLLGLYESLGAAWIFVVFSGMLRIIIVNILVSMFMQVMDPNTGLISQIYSGDKYTGFYFLILSTILDVIFFPLITLFIIQFWEFVIKSYAKLAGVQIQVDQKVRSIVSISLSSHIFLLAPIIGEMAQKVASFVQMYAGIREQFGFSRSLTLCVLATPLVIGLFFLSLIALLSAV